MPAVTLFRGPCHVIEYADSEAIAVGGRDGRGIPVREIYTEPKWYEALAAMDEVYRTGRLIQLARPNGTLLLGPRVDSQARVFGVASYFVALPSVVRLDPIRDVLELPALDLVR